MLAKFMSIVLLMAASYTIKNKEVVEDSNLVWQRWLYALAVACYNDIVLQGIVDPHPKINVFVIALSTLLWYLSAFVIMPQVLYWNVLVMHAGGPWQKDYGLIVTIVTPCVVLLGLPFTRWLLGALGFTRERTIRNVFYHPDGNDGLKTWTMDWMNKLDWPAAPIYICNCTQQDIIDSKTLMETRQEFYTPEFEGVLNHYHFEVTAHHWGSSVIGFWRPPTDLWISTPMAMSAAALSQTVGSAAPNSGWLGSLTHIVNGAMGILGAEMGRPVELRRFHKWRSWGWRDKQGMVNVTLQRLPELFLIGTIFVLSISQILTLKGQVDDNFSGAPIAFVDDNGVCTGFECSEDGAASSIAGSHYAASVTFLSGFPAALSFNFKGADDLWNYKHWQGYLNSNSSFTTGSTTHVTTMDFMQYMSRYNIHNDANLCNNQDKFVQSVSECQAGGLRTLSSVPWFANTTRKYITPLYSYTDIQCREASFLEIYRQMTKEYGGKCTTYCCTSASIAVAVVQARFVCGPVKTLVITIFVFLATMIIVYFGWPSFTAITPIWSLGFSHLANLMSRTLGFVLVIPFPDKHPPPEIFLTDGGHFEDSGAFPLLKRKVKTIVAVCSDPTRVCTDMYELIKLSRHYLGCSWGVGGKHMRSVDPWDSMLDFRLPRARFIGMGLESCGDPDELMARERRARDLMMGVEAWRTIEALEEALDDDHVLLWTKLAMRQYVSHIRVHRGHIYLYFKTDECCLKAFLQFPSIRKNFKICQSIEDTSGLSIEDDFLESEVMRKETLRHSIRFSVRYNDNTHGDFFFLRGETSPEDLVTVHASLKPYEPRNLPWTTLSLYPHHELPAEGFTWPHIDAYAEFSKISMQHAWDHGLKEMIVSNRPKKVERSGWAQTFGVPAQLWKDSCIPELTCDHDDRTYEIMIGESECDLVSETRQVHQGIMSRACV